MRTPHFLRFVWTVEEASTKPSGQVEKFRALSTGRWQLVIRVTHHTHNLFCFLALLISSTYVSTPPLSISYSIHQITVHPSVQPNNEQSPKNNGLYGYAEGESPQEPLPRPTNQSGLSEKTYVLRVPLSFSNVKWGGGGGG